MTNKPILSVELRAFLEGVVKLCAVHGPTYNELRALLDKEVDEDSHAPKHQGVPPLIATLHENGELIAAQATIAQQAKLIELLKGKGQGDPVAIVDESDDGLFIEFVYGENGSPLKCGDKLYAKQPAPVAVAHTMRSVMEITQEASQFYVPGTSNWCGHIANRLNGVKP